MQNRVESVCYGGRPLIHCLFNVCTVRKHSETDAEFYTPAQLLYVGTAGSNNTSQDKWGELFNYNQSLYGSKENFTLLVGF